MDSCAILPRLRLSSSRHALLGGSVGRSTPPGRVASNGAEKAKLACFAQPGSAAASLVRKQEGGRHARAGPRALAVPPCPICRAPRFENHGPKHFPNISEHFQMGWHSREVKALFHLLMLELGDCGRLDSPRAPAPSPLPSAGAPPSPPELGLGLALLGLW